MKNERNIRKAPRPRFLNLHELSLIGLSCASWQRWLISRSSRLIGHFSTLRLSFRRIREEVIRNGFLERPPKHIRMQCTHMRDMKQLLHDLSTGREGQSPRYRCQRSYLPYFEHAFLRVGFWDDRRTYSCSGAYAEKLCFLPNHGP